ncbi:MAG TPA: hypothetical protein VFF11_01025 [Candidatus Binatia bacterium]|nr:hypothetical protein [Candidatus Binatia bacterium]
MNNKSINRPSLIEALAVWQECLARHGLPTQTLWIFTENICIEPSRVTPGSFRLGFQTKFTPPSDDALEIAYDLFGETDARMVFYRLGSCARGSVCILLCDNWFEEKNAHEGFERHDPWGISFYPGHPGEVDEVTELPRWLKRVKNDRAFHDFDFAMSLATIDEVKIHGRPLLPYERFAESMLNRLRRVLGNPG